MYASASPARRKWLPWTGVALSVAIAVCAFAPLAMWVAGTPLTSYYDDSQVVNTCLIAAVRGDPHVGVSWSCSPKIRDSAWVGIRTTPSMTCLQLPRLRFLPTTGTFRFPAEARADL